MKVFQVRFSIVLILFFSLIASTILVPNSSAQDTQIPDWIKNVAGWWADNQISENVFLTGITYLINNNIISLSAVPCGIFGTSSSESVPGWVKNNAKWWSEDLIEDTDFINGIEYLVKKHIIGIDYKKIVGKVPVEDVTLSSLWKFNNSFRQSNFVFVQSSFFEVYGINGDCEVDNVGNFTSLWRSLILGLNSNKIEQGGDYGRTYNEVAVWDDPQKTVVVYPYFTHTAYADKGFYAYYSGECDDCTTTKFIDPAPAYTSSGIGIQALSLMGYTTIIDMDIDKNPSVLQQFDKVIMLHNEYVTRTMFDAITSHPNVLYLYPNALYAEIEVNYIDETITLIRGHSYPESEIENGFGWEFDNTHPYEFDSDCSDMAFYKIENGWMANCYPENVFLKGVHAFSLLKAIKDL